tara:strand:+ start:720 stop:1193 length:474 start_codon:yes stop_codon:yes gene_type:complete
MRYLIILVFFVVAQCGFTPMYKLESGGVGLDQLSIQFVGEVENEIEEELENIVGTDQADTNYVVSVEVKKDQVPIIINENGTVSKYQIDIALFFEVKNNLGEAILESVSVGFAQYDVLTSEIDNEDLEEQMVRSATNDAASLMITKIQSKLSLINDN